MEKAKIKISTVGKIFNFLEKEKGEKLPKEYFYLSEPIPFEIAKEDLTVTKFQNGDPIPEAKTEEEWLELGKEKLPGFMRYLNYFHYNYYAVIDKRGICPPGWRVPTEEDLLFIKYKRLYELFPFTRYRHGYVKSKFMKPNGSVTMSIGGYYWSSDVVDDYYARALVFKAGSEPTKVLNLNVTAGLSIRCVRDKK